MNRPDRPLRQRPGTPPTGPAGPSPADEPPPLDGPLADLVGNLADGARIIGWSEGVHLRTEYLVARNAVVRHLVERHGLRAVAAETNFSLSRPADAYIRGAGPREPSPAAVRGVWSWAGSAELSDNSSLLRWLRRHNARLPAADQVRFYGLEMYGTTAENPDGVPDSGTLDEADLRHAGSLHRSLVEHRAAGGDHRDLAVRDAAQYRTLREIARRHPHGPVLVFEQVEHLDRRVSGSLGEHLARGRLGPFRAVGAVWRDGDPSVAYPLGRYRDLSARLGRLAEHGDHGLLAGPAATRVLDLLPWRTASGPAPAGAAGPPPRDTPGGTGPEGGDAPLADAASAFDAVLYAPDLTPARQETAPPRAAKTWPPAP
ncbi:erythromycin esterase family protein [Streptomyces sp. DW26H14]|uniref:erythromycin esterase family protein n=1 Tax=Streptomyces sp. DW26H14 TaxID=3435395 RepID=UPI00403E174E